MNSDSRGDAHTFYEGQSSSVFQGEHMYCIVECQNAPPFTVVFEDQHKKKTPTTFEVWSVIQLSNAKKNVCRVKFQRQIVEVYDEGTMNEGNVR
jgi:hypothetical protein